MLTNMSSLTNGSSTMGGLESTRDRADEISPQTTIRVRKRNGSTEPVDVNKIVRAVSRCCSGLCDVDALRIATKTISGLYNGATTRELDLLSIQTAASLIVEEPQYSKLAARLLAACIDKEVRGHEIYAFSQSVAFARDLGLAIERLASFVANNARKLNDAIDSSRDREFEYFGLRTLYDRYLLKHPTKRLVIETTHNNSFSASHVHFRKPSRKLWIFTIFSLLWHICQVHQPCSMPAHAMSNSPVVS